jgi:hypothetical protein
MFCKITRDLSTVLERNSMVAPVPPEELAEGKPYWVPLVETVDNQATGPETVSSTAETIHADRVERVRTIRDKTAQELDADKTARVDAVDRLQFEVMFLLINEVRTLKGQPEITRPQFKTFLKGLF